MDDWEISYLDFSWLKVDGVNYVDGYVTTRTYSGEAPWLIYDHICAIYFWDAASVLNTFSWFWSLSAFACKHSECLPY
jgi:hypothetical protein